MLLAYMEKYENIARVFKGKFGVLRLCLLVGLLSSCDSNVVFEQNFELPEKIWEVGDIKQFEVEIKDTNQAYNLYLNLRNSKSYRFSNLYVFVKTKYPKGKITKDTLQFYLADPNGKWLGKNAGDLVNHQIMFSRKTQFPELGVYSIEFEQGMRDANLEYVSDVGLRVETFK